MRVFLQTYFPNSETVKQRNEINQFLQANRSHSGSTLIDLITSNPNVLTMVLIKPVYAKSFMKVFANRTGQVGESMCQRCFFSMSPSDAWEFLEDLAEKTIRDDS